MDSRLFDKLNEQDRSSFFTDVKVSVLVDIEEDYTWTNKVNVEYDITVDYRSWGINGYTLGFKNKPTVTIDFDSGRTEDIVVNLENATIDWKAGGIIAPLSLDLWLNEDLSVKEITINVSYVGKE